MSHTFDPSRAFQPTCVCTKCLARVKGRIIEMVKMGTAKRKAPANWRAHERASEACKSGELFSPGEGVVRRGEGW